METLLKFMPKRYNIFFPLRVSFGKGGERRTRRGSCITLFENLIIGRNLNKNSLPRELSLLTQILNLSKMETKM